MYEQSTHPHDPEYSHPNPRDDGPPRTARGLLVYLAVPAVVLGVAVAVTAPVVAAVALAGAVVGLAAGAAVVRRLDDARSGSASTADPASTAA